MGRADVGSGKSGGLAAVSAVHLHQPVALDAAAGHQAASRRGRLGRPAAADRPVPHIDVDARRGGGGDGRNGLAVRGFGLLRRAAGAVVVSGVAAAGRAGRAERGAAGGGDRGALAAGAGERAGGRPTAESRGDGRRGAAGVGHVLGGRPVRAAAACLPCDGMGCRVGRAHARGADPLRRPRRGCGRCRWVSCWRAV